MKSNSIRGACEQTRAPDFERITKSDQLTVAEHGLILRSQSEDASGTGRVVDVEVFPDVRRRGHLGGSYICPQCRGLHSSYLGDDGDIIRRADCNGYVSPDGTSIDGIRLRWRRPEHMPAAMAADIDRPQVDWSPVSRALELNRLALELHGRRAVEFADHERRRLISVFRRFVRCNEYQAELAERLKGDETRRNVGRVQRELRREMVRRHIGVGRQTLARKVKAAASVLECIHSRGGLFW